ncbi:hypothetical protein [Lactobacillus plantarum subsp. plantarum ST-III] [Lactiplantibacillus mudanjiangensis]|uniref:nuclear transport factor 2 family protein n=1 Tax=Lactiplantibacillus mudanjiangensis TaxID=1296538 RepID=UPI0010147A45|nr:hypothetical protein [Lactobacillus plantarum subsp. plantarum ST-III] [Lactiplantibacillus mudanjiangensis]
MDDLEVKAVKKVCRQQIQGMLTKNVELLDQIIDANAVFVHITGEQQRKTDWLKQIKNGRMTYFSSQELRLTVEISGDQAIAKMSNILEARIYGFRNKWSLGADMKLLKKENKWRIISSKAKLV